MTDPNSYSNRASIGLTKPIPAGYLRMGSRFHPREQPKRTVYVAEFEIAHAPVTVSQYSVFIDSRQVEQPRWWSESGWRWLNGSSWGWGREYRALPDGWKNQARRPYHPVVGISIYEVQAYCAWLSHQKERTVRLPTEIEWEYAARGEDERPFPWGDEFNPTFTNTLESERRDTIEAGSLQSDASPFGVLDMAGNVQEWTSSPYTPLQEEVVVDSEQYTTRGGSYNDTAFGARTSYRRPYPAGYFYPFLGFRVVVEHR